MSAEITCGTLDWAYRARIYRQSNNYSAAPQFARHVARIDPEVADRLLVIDRVILPTGGR
jgi:hypothetical protein